MKDTPRVAAVPDAGVGEPVLLGGQEAEALDPAVVRRPTVRGGPLTPQVPITAKTGLTWEPLPLPSPVLVLP